MEAGYKVTTVVFDKTGTLTRGQPVVTSVAMLVSTTVMPESVFLAYVGALEVNSEHPFAAGIVKYARAHTTIPFPTIQAFEAVPGRGVSGTIDGHGIRAGTRAWMSDGGVVVSREVEDVVVDLEEQGNSVILVGQRGIVLGIVALADVVKPDARIAVSVLQQRGIKVVMLTGDNHRTARGIANKVGITVVNAEVLPSHKAACIKDLQVCVCVYIYLCVCVSVCVSLSVYETQAILESFSNHSLTHTVPLGPQHAPPLCCARACTHTHTLCCSGLHTHTHPHCARACRSAARLSPWLAMASTTPPASRKLTSALPLARAQTWLLRLRASSSSKSVHPST